MHQVLTHETSVCAVCQCKTIFPQVGSTKLNNNVSKMLLVAYPGVRDNRSTLNTKTGYDMMNIGH